MALFKKKDKKDDVLLDKDGKPIELDEEMEDGLGNKIVMAFVTLLVILIWLGIIILLIKWDFGGFGSTILRPMIKDVPYLNNTLRVHFQPMNINHLLQNHAFCKF